MMYFKTCRTMYVCVREMKHVHGNAIAWITSRYIKNINSQSEFRLKRNIGEADIVVVLCINRPLDCLNNCVTSQVMIRKMHFFPVEKLDIFLDISVFYHIGYIKLWQLN